MATKVKQGIVKTIANKTLRQENVNLRVENQILKIFLAVSVIFILVLALKNIGE